MLVTAVLIRAFDWYRPTSMTLNDLERRNSLYFAFFSPNSTDFQADYITVVKDRPIMSVKYCLPVLSSTFGEDSNAPCSTRGVAEYSDFGPIERYISETVQGRS